MPGIDKRTDESWQGYQIFTVRRARQLLSEEIYYVKKAALSGPGERRQNSTLDRADSISFVLGGRICNPPRPPSALRLDVPYRIVLLYHPEKHSLCACSRAFLGACSWTLRLPTIDNGLPCVIALSVHITLHIHAYSDTKYDSYAHGRVYPYPNSTRCY